MSDLVCLDGVTKSFKRGSEEIRAVDLIDLTLTDGEYVAIVGPSGSGKTTLLNMIGCIDKPSEGSVEIGGVRTDVLRDSELARVRASTFGFVFQQFFLMPTLTSIENVMVPGRFAVNKQKDLSERARSLLELVGMSDRA
ncbi:MAG TPA: ATP-binding cassette domain-containing protein, partial [Candidatus Anoxymicrobiaceae bacterium]